MKALKGISLCFRRNEFVAILGPSGCGKTTMLNLIGGLDSATEGELLINGRSTRDYKDRDWDTYRNHSVGFVFQSYNLIPHQSVLQNVELALTLSGVSKAERRRRAKEALEQVGLGNQLKKKPGEMSGGQMQRVAIARAIVNNPDIILADEPTGALDTETSIQVMDILQEIARDRLVIMVTHNPDLAERYATRTVRMLDGLITDDSAPLSAEEIEAETEAAEQRRRENDLKKLPSMSLRTSFGLSLKNLFTKKGRTILTAFAGSIGIIGISLIYAVSQGTTNYIDLVQEQTLSSYPLTLEAQTVDMGSLLTTFMGKAQSISRHEKDAVYQKAMVYELMNTMNTLDTKKNDLQAFKAHLETELQKEDSPLSEAVSAVSYRYNLNLQFYTKNVDGEIILSDAQSLMTDLFSQISGVDFSSLMKLGGSSGMTSTMSSSANVWQELLEGQHSELINPVVEKQYDIIAGHWPQNFDEVVLFVDERNEVNDLYLYALGLLPEEAISSLMQAAVDHDTVTYDRESWSYEDILNLYFRVILAADRYTYDEASGKYVDLSQSDTGLAYLYDNALKLKVVGIARPNEDAVGHMVTGSVGYTAALTRYVVEKAHSCAAVKAQLESPDTDILTGLPFKDSGKKQDAEKAALLKEHLNELSEAEKAKAYIRIKSIPSDQMVTAALQQAMAGMTRDDIEAALAGSMGEQMGMDSESVMAYIRSMSDEDLKELISKAMEDQIRQRIAAETAVKMSAMPPAQLAAGLAMELSAASDADCAVWYDALMEFSESTYEMNLIRLGCVELDTPSAINLYASSFDNKDIIEQEIAAYNDTVEDVQEIRYTDYIGLMMSSVTTIIDAITYVLIAFVSVSLIVSSIMIGVITLISVQERTKEIGILRAIGASKRNVSSMFNAETVMIGFTSGLIGVLVTYLLCIPINLILHALTDINNLNAVLPVPVAVILVVISMLLTLIAGVIPSRSAAKKDPVIALRTE